MRGSTNINNIVAVSDEYDYGNLALTDPLG